MNGRDVLLVDANLHQPSIHRFFRLGVEDGLGEIIEHRLDWRKFVKPIYGSDLKVITAGKTDLMPAELLGSLEFGNVVEKWREQFRYVLFDSPPILPYVESLCLSAVSDGIVLIVRAGQTRWEVAQNAKRKLVAANANLIGVTLNQRKLGRPDTV